MSYWDNVFLIDHFTISFNWSLNSSKSTTLFAANSGSFITKKAVTST